MRRTRPIIIIISFLALIIVGVVVALWRYPFRVDKYKDIVLGMDALEKAGDSTGWAPPDDIVPNANFYIFAFGDESFCISAGCGIGGYFVECLGGWISGYRQMGWLENDFGLDSSAVETGKEKVVMVANANAKIVGIYPGARIRNLPYILRNHRDLADAEMFKKCSDILPSRWR